MAFLEEQALEIGYNIIKQKGWELLKKHIIPSDEKQLKEKFEQYLERKRKENWFCSIEEEIDFEGLSEYILGDLCNDAEQRIFGTRQEREAARHSILDRACLYAQANTSLKEERVKRIITSVLETLKKFYRSKIPSEMRLCLADASDDICSCVEKHAVDIKAQIDGANVDIKQILQESSILSVESNMKHIRDGDISKVEDNLTLGLNALGASHELYPDYRTEFRYDGDKMRAYSVPCTQCAKTKYPPRMELGCTAKLAGKDITNLDEECFDYSYRHQIPIEVNVVEAQKYLGPILDPFQSEAKQEVGKRHKLYPPAFPPAFPCNIIGKNGVIIEYLLLRTKEILDDGTFIVTNEEQNNPPFRIAFKFNAALKSMHFSLGILNESNTDQLLIAKITKQIFESAYISVHSLERGENLIEGKIIPPQNVPHVFTIDEKIGILEKVIVLEKYYNKSIIIPNDITYEDRNKLHYLSELIEHIPQKLTWTTLETSFDISDKLKSDISKDKDHEYCFIYHDVTRVELWGSTYELEVKKTFPYATISQWDKLIKKISNLELGDPIKICFIPGKSGNEMLEEIWPST